MSDPWMLYLSKIGPDTPCTSKLIDVLKNACNSLNFSWTVLEFKKAYSGHPDVSSKSTLNKSLVTNTSDCHAGISKMH